MRYRFLTTDVFTDRLFGGNQLAVFPDARGLGTQCMQQVARELNLSETVFVFPADAPQHTRRLRIFTPGREVPFAGHPTIGCALVLAAIGEVPATGQTARIVFEEGAGPVPVSIRFEAGRAQSAQLTAAQRPRVGPQPPSNQALAAMLSLNPGELLDGDWSPQAVSCGVPFLFIPVRDRSVLARVRLDLARWESLLSAWWATEVHVFARDPERAGSDLRARMFAPAMGIAEDPATGAAAAALGGYLAAREAATDGGFRWVLEQGFEMGRPSILEIEADKQGGEIVATRVGGTAVMVSEGFMEIPAEG